ncbi:MAG: thymidine kinase [Bacilli bacterium]|nr:thymidine kinase [Bacilli bacterium]
MDIQLKEGWLEVICGCMFAGKTEELIRRLKRLEYAKKSYLLFKPKIDNRYSEKEVVSHNLNKKNSIIIENAADLIKNLPSNLPYAIAIDEVQFFGEDMIPVIQDLANRGVRVIVAGLDTDFRAEPFGIMPSLLALAEDVTKLHAICQCCGSLASRTQRLINGSPARYSDPIILVGAKEQYEARCRHCHIVIKD